MQVSVGGKRSDYDSGSWKDLGKIVVDKVKTAGETVGGGVTGLFIDGVGLPYVSAKEIGRSIGRDLLNLVKGEDVPNSLKKLPIDIISLPLDFAICCLGGVMIGPFAGAFSAAGALSDKKGLGASIDYCNKIVTDYHNYLKDINREPRGYFSIFGDRPDKYRFRNSKD